MCPTPGLSLSFFISNVLPGNSASEGAVSCSCLVVEREGRLSERAPHLLFVALGGSRGGEVAAGRIREEGLEMFVRFERPQSCQMPRVGWKTCLQGSCCSRYSTSALAGLNILPSRRPINSVCSL